MGAGDDSGGDRMTRQQKDLKVLAQTVSNIEAQQKVNPGYCNDVLMSIVNSELRRCGEESCQYWQASPELTEPPEPPEK